MGKNWNARCCAASHKEDAWKTKKEEKVRAMGANEEQDSVRPNWVKEKMWDLS